MSVAARIQTLANEVFEPTDLTSFDLTQSIKSRSAAFILLAHAEMEHALEKECEKIADLLQGAVEPTTAMLAWGFMSVKADGSFKGKASKSLKDLVEIYRRELDQNNGIRTKHLTSLLTPIGVDMTVVNLDIQALDNFGERRGPLAHIPLAHWKTSNMPSTHVSNAIQAGESADRIISAIRSGHSKVIPKPVKQGLKWRHWLAQFLHRMARNVDR